MDEMEKVLERHIFPSSFKKKYYQNLRFYSLPHRRQKLVEGNTFIQDQP
jgi:hypothetical protein